MDFKEPKKIILNNTWDNSLNTKHISTNLAGYEAARSSFFVFSVPASELKNLIKPDVDPSSGGFDLAEEQKKAEKDDTNSSVYNAEKVSEWLRLNVLKASVPTFTVEAKPYRRGNDVVKFAGVPTFNDGSITVDDIVGLHVKDMLYAWLYLAYNPNSRMGGRMKDYKKVAYLTEYTQDYQEIRTWTLEGCFITGIDEGEFDRENDDKRQLTVNISYDRATVKPVYDSF